MKTSWNFNNLKFVVVVQSLVVPNSLQPDGLQHASPAFTISRVCSDLCPLSQ